MFTDKLHICGLIISLGLPHREELRKAGTSITSGHPEGEYHHENEVSGRKVKKLPWLRQEQGVPQLLG